MADLPDRHAAVAEAFVSAVEQAQRQVLVEAADDDRKTQLGER